MPRGMPRGAPEEIDAGHAQGVGGDGVAGAIPELEGDVVDPRLGRLDEVDDVVLAVASEEVRDPRDVVGENEAEKVPEVRDQLVAVRVDNRDVAEAQQRCAGLLEAGNRSFDRVVELDDQAARRLDLDQFGNAGLTVGLYGRSEASLAYVAGEVADRDVRLQVKAHMEQRLLLDGAQNEIVMVVADRQVDRSVVSARDLSHAEILEIVILRPFDVRRPQRDISELEHLRIEFPALHGLLLFNGLRQLAAFEAIVQKRGPPE